MCVCVCVCVCVYAHILNHFSVHLKHNIVNQPYVNFLKSQSTTNNSARQYCWTGHKWAYIHLLWKPF